jgi:hypothetical protein
MTSLKPETPVVQTSLLYKTQLMQPSQGATMFKRHAKAQYLSPSTQCFIPFPKSPTVQLWQIGAQTVQQHAPH